MRASECVTIAAGRAMPHVPPGRPTERPPLPASAWRAGAPQGPAPHHSPGWTWAIAGPALGNSVAALRPAACSAAAVGM